MRHLIVLDPFVYSHINDSDIVLLDCATGTLKTYSVSNNIWLKELSANRQIEIDEPFSDELIFLIEQGWAVKLKPFDDPFIQNHRVVTKKDYEGNNKLFSDDVSRYFNRVVIDLLSDTDVFLKTQNSLMMFLNDFGKSLSAIVLKVKNIQILELMVSSLPKEKLTLHIPYIAVSEFDTQIFNEYRTRLIISESDFNNIPPKFHNDFAEIEMQFESENGLARVLDKIKIDPRIIPTPLLKDNYEFLKTILQYNPEEVLGRKCHPKDIVRNSIMNQLFFGQLFLKDGMIGAVENSLSEQYSKENIYKIIRNELVPGSHWRMVRNMFAPCNICNYQELCPPIQEIETKGIIDNLNVFCNVVKISTSTPLTRKSSPSAKPI